MTVMPMWANCAPFPGRLFCTFIAALFPCVEFCSTQANVNETYFMHKRSESATLAATLKKPAHERTISTGEQAYHQVRTAIVRCLYGPGERLRVEELCDRFGVSSSPVREALHRLTVEGLVVALDQRGFRVAPMTIDGIRDLTRVRLLVETEALSDAVGYGNDAWEGGVVAAAHQLSKIERSLSEGPAALDEHWAECHRTFHLTLYRGSGSPLLVQYSASLFDLADRYRRYSATTRTTPRAKRTEHRRILEAVLERNVEVSVALLRRHIEATERNVVEALASGIPRITQ
jgi:GntR family transcriptional regulator, carbon starvation induced regulator